MIGLRAERGSALLESVFAIFFVSMLALGTIQIAFALYGRNVLMSAAHEAARVAVEREATSLEAEGLARATIERAAGRLVHDLTVDVHVGSGDRRLVVVGVEGKVRGLGPVPVPVPVVARASAAAEVGIE